MKNRSQQDVRDRVGTTAEHVGLVLPSGSITVDSTKNVVVVHDGATPGGHPLAPEGSTPQNTFFVPAASMVPRYTAGAGVFTEEFATNDTNYDTLTFDAATVEGAQFLFALPAGWTNIKVKFYWTASSGSGDVVWGASAQGVNNDDPLDAVFGTEVTVTDTLITASDMHVTAATGTITPANAPAVGNPMLIQITRDADAAGDTLAVDAKLIGVLVEKV